VLRNAFGERFAQDDADPPFILSGFVVTGAAERRGIFSAHIYEQQ